MDNKKHCRQGIPVLDIDAVPESVSILKFNFNGVSTWYDFKDLVEKTQTDTAISVDTLVRAIKYAAERHVDTITAAELGSIMHLADLADVEQDDIVEGSLLQYKNRKWTVYNPGKDSVVTTDDDANIKTIETPTNASEYYQLGWNANNKVSYHQPREVSTIPTDSDGNTLGLFLDPSTKEIVFYRIEEE